MEFRTRKTTIGSAKEGTGDKKGRDEREKKKRGGGKGKRLSSSEGIATNTSEEIKETQRGSNRRNNICAATRRIRKKHERGRNMDTEYSDAQYPSKDEVVLEGRNVEGPGGGGGKVERGTKESGKFPELGSPEANIGGISRACLRTLAKRVRYYFVKGGIGWWFGEEEKTGG